MKKWTKAEREEASRKGKERWAARAKRDVRSAEIAPANASSFVLTKQALAIDVVRLIGHDVPADVIVKVVERILRS